MIELLRKSTIDNETAVRSVVSLNLRQRSWAAATALLLIGLLGMAGLLTPNDSGMGTHRQLGLPPCTFVTIFGVRCPTCGMTTSWSHFMHGEWAAAWNANPGGLLLAVMSAMISGWALQTAWRGRYRPLLSERTLVLVLVAIAAITIGDWGWRLLDASSWATGRSLID